MKRILIISGIVVALIALGVFNKLTSSNKKSNFYAEVSKGIFEITVSSSGELLPEQSLEIKGPEITQSNNNRSRGRSDHMRVMDLKILDIVAEGTLVKEGDYIAQLDRSSYENTLKDQRENLITYQTNMDMKILDTAVVLTNLRDAIKNQTYTVEEAAITLEQSKYEPPATIRKAEMNLDRATRALEQKKKSYDLQVARKLKEINRERDRLEDGTQLVNDLEEYLSKLAPAPGMVIYMKERTGAKRKTGSSVNPFDLVIATLPDLSSMISKIYISEIDISKVKTGQKANIKVDAFPDKSFSGNVISIANVGEQLPNSDSKMFEVEIKIDGSDTELRPSMTTDNKIIIDSFADAIFIPTECVYTGADSIPFVYGKNRTKQIVLLGKSNEKNVIIEQGLKPGETIFLIPPENAETFRLAGEELIPVIQDRIKAKIAENERYR